MDKKLGREVGGGGGGGGGGGYHLNIFIHLLKIQFPFIITIVCSLRLGNNIC